MKCLHRFIHIAWIGLLCACGPIVTFDSPQPNGVDALENIPRRLQGNYANQNDNSTLTIQDQIIIRKLDWTAMENIKDLDSSFYIKGSYLINIDTKEKYRAKTIGDSVEINVNLVDTIFQLSQTNVLKKFRGYYFLNKNINSTSWSVTKLSISKGILTLGDISTEEEINNLREITETNLDTTSFNFKPTPKQFKQFIKHNRFSSNDTYILIKK